MKQDREARRQQKEAEAIECARLKDSIHQAIMRTPPDGNSGTLLRLRNLRNGTPAQQAKLRKQD
jgi:hypothetical protein